VEVLGSLVAAVEHWQRIGALIFLEDQELPAELLLDEARDVLLSSGEEAGVMTGYRAAPGEGSAVS
jgi:hypothetical protein